MRNRFRCPRCGPEAERPGAPNEPIRRFRRPTSAALQPFGSPARREHAIRRDPPNPRSPCLPQRTILRELHRRHQDAAIYTRPATIRGFDRNPARDQETVNRLISERLINGAKDEEGRLAVQLNPERMAAVRRELRPWFVRHLAPLAALAGFALALFWLVT